MEVSFIYDLIVCMYLGKVAWVDFKTSCPINDF